MVLALLLTAFAMAGVVVGVLIGETRGLPPKIAAAGAGLLFGIPLFWLLPEMAQRSGWRAGVLALTLGAATLWCVDHFVYPICPSCSHGHDHEHCSAPPLHGFAAPILIATGVHSILDGWSIRFFSGDAIAGVAAQLGLALHKIPEGLAVGLITREAMSSTNLALLMCIAAESLTVVGALIEPGADHTATRHLGQLWVTGVLALVGGSFLFLGFHTVHGNRKTRGVIPTFLATLVTLAGVAWVHWRFGAL
jgi:zinc and cadmium transporter